MVWLQVALLVQLSVARHVRVMLNVLLPQKPTVLVTVLSTVTVRFVPSHKSFTVGGMKLQAVPHSTIRSSAQARTGGVVSTTVMVWLHVELFVQESVARHVRVELKLRPQNPAVLVTVSTSVTMTFVPSQTSFTFGTPKTQEVPHSTIRSGAQLSTGG